MNDILIGKGETPVHLLAKYGNRHGLVAGATGTGKSVSLMVIAEGFSRLGVPVFLADVKGDVAGLAMPGSMNPKIAERVAQIGIEGYANEANPVVFWDLYGKSGHPVRATVSEIGPTLLARMLELNDTQSGVLDIAFKLADDHGWLLLDLDDLRALLGFVAEHRKEISTDYGLVSAPSIGAIQRALLRLEQDGDAQFFGEPALELADLMRTDLNGRGVINVLAADQLILRPRLYSSFLLWLLSELFENLPEVGDLEKPKLVFVFDEAHLLFDDAPPALRQRVEQVVRIIRSKGVGVYFCSQFPDDVPDDILGQLGNRIQHALRAYTPRDQKAVRTAAETFVANPGVDVAQAISQLGTGEALGVDAAGKRHPDAGAAHAGVPAALPHGRDHARRARRCARAQPRRREIRHGREPRIGTRDPDPQDSAADLRADAPAAGAHAVGTGAANTRAARERRPRAENERVAVGHQAPPGRGGDHGETDRAHHGQPPGQPDPARRAGRHIQVALTGGRRTP